MLQMGVICGTILTCVLNTAVFAQGVDPPKQLRNNAAPSNRKNLSEDDNLSKSQETSQAVESAIRKSLRLLERASAGAVEHRKCFTCHHQALPVLVFVQARNRGFTIDEDNLKLQIKQTVEYAAPRRTAIAHGYALWALEAGGWNSDESTAALTGFLLKTQQKGSHWRGEPLDKARQIRPPAAGSDFATTYVALRG
ncbi:MAG: hypothetical protein H8E37_09135 [Planctomycetes bacterium]|nr:hypothetical protein [Planctomycetota bacterium]